MIKIIPYIACILFGTLLHFDVNAKTTSSITQTQSRLKELDIKMGHLKQALASAHDKRDLLHQEVFKTEKSIGEGMLQLRSITQNLHSKEQEISQLQSTVDRLNKQLAAQQQLLATHVRARYRIGEYQPLKWMLNQDDPYKLNRILTYYQYIIKSHQNLIKDMNETSLKINKNKSKLDNELVDNQKLHTQLVQHQQDLQQNKMYHRALIHSLSSEIQTNQQALEDAQKNKENLSNLLKSLAQESQVHINQSFAQMRKKLPFPVQTNRQQLQKMNQGVTFFADEGSMVTAVYPGKIVFSGWLKGYGLILIIDHGQGFMTLYAHNQSLFKHKGQTVNQQEHIAAVGHSGGIKQNGLYFEIRVKGKAVPPLTWLS